MKQQNFNLDHDFNLDEEKFTFFYVYFFFNLIQIIISPFRIFELFIFRLLAPFQQWSQYFSFFINNSELIVDKTRMQKCTYLVNVSFFNKLGTRLMRNGLKTSQLILEKFYIFLKFYYQIDPWYMVYVLFLTRYELPFKVSYITRSNRKHLFPDPFLNDQEIYRFLLKKFGIAVRKRSEQFFLGRVFGELIDFLNKRPSSALITILEGLFLQGMENRAYIHYRWYKRKM